MNINALTALLPSARQRSADALPATREHLSVHGGYVAWSGGKDSTTVVSIARTINPNVPVCFFNSGLEYPETLTYIKGLAAFWALNLHIITAQPDALTIMAAAGGWDHNRETNWEAPDLHDTIVTQPALVARTRFGSAELWGLRASESRARRALLAPGKGRIVRADGTVAFSPIWNWRDIDVTSHLAAQNIALNPVYAKLEKLGAHGRDLRVGLMLDGNGLSNGRAVWLRRGWPEQWDRMTTALPRLQEWR